MNGSRKLVIVINGRGGAGKDTLCGFAAERYRVLNVSSITPIKEMAAFCGWQGEKTDAARKFLSDLKRLTVDYCDFPTKYLLERYKEFDGGKCFGEVGGADGADCEIMFAHIREGGEIAKFVSGVRALGGRVLTLLIRRGRPDSRGYGNDSDDNVEQYDYDLYYNNDKPLDEAREDFLKFLGDTVSAEITKGE